MIFKIATAADWAEAERAGVFHGSAHDKSDGFMHFSTGPQLAETLRLYYSGQNGVVLAAVDEASLGDALKWEHSASRGEDFPHLYGPLPMSAVQSTMFFNSVESLRPDMLAHFIAGTLDSHLQDVAKNADRPI